MTTTTATAPHSTPSATSETTAPPLHAAFAGVRRVPPPINDPNRSYAPGSPERAELKARLKSMASEKIEIPLVIGGKEIRTGRIEKSVMPHDHQHVLAEYHKAGPEHVQQAIAAAAEARREWASWAWEDRAAVVLRAAELLATTWRSTINAATMLGQSKTAMQAEIDAASEMIDFWRFNAWFAQELYNEQPVSSPGMWNQMEYRNLEGFVYAITPFNFTAIGGNLTTAPALMGNTVIWKPASAAMLSGYYTLKVLEAAGLPPGVINFLPGDPQEISNHLIDSPDLAGIHFTGSTAVFNSMWKRVGENMGRYRTYPRLVGETGGKDFIVMHPSADPQEVAVAIARGGFEYQGQKCSAASRVYIPQSLWNDVRDRDRGDDEGHQGRRRARLPQLLRRRHRQEGVRQDQRVPGRREEEREGDSGRRREGRDRVLHRADARRDRRPRRIASSARRSSDRSSPRTCIRTPSGRRRSPSSTGRRPTR